MRFAPGRLCSAKVWSSGASVPLSGSDAAAGGGRRAGGQRRVELVLDEQAAALVDLQPAVDEQQLAELVGRPAVPRGDLGQAAAEQVDRALAVRLALGQLDLRERRLGRRRGRARGGRRLRQRGVRRGGQRDERRLQECSHAGSFEGRGAWSHRATDVAGGTPQPSASICEFIAAGT